jgi:hypothetical protein
MQPNSQVTVNEGTGIAIAAHLIGGKRYQAFMPLDDSGHIQQTVPTYTWWLPPNAAAASKLYGDIFNPVGSGRILEVRGIWAIPKSDVAITATLGIEIGLYRTSSPGTNGTAYTYNGGTASTAHVITPWDTNNAALTTAQVTARGAGLTAGATISALWWAQYIQPEETNAGTYVCAFTNMIPVGTMNQRLTLNENQGLLIKQGTVALVGSLAFLTLLTVFQP